MRDNFKKVNSIPWGVAFLFVLSTILLFSISSCGPKQKAPSQPKSTAHKNSSWENAQKEVDKSVPALLTQHQAEVDRGIYYHKFFKGKPSKKEIAITFDDGPHPKYTPHLLAILKKYNAKATFFVVGEMAEKHPELIQDEIAAGHSVGNHTYHHVNLTKIPQDDVAAEVQGCTDVLKGITGKTPHLFRPPGGDYNKKVAEVSTAFNYTMVLWTDDPGDYASPGAKIIQTRLLDRVGNGGIILIHDGIQQTVDVLPQILNYLKGRGYTFVTVDQLMKDSKFTGAAVKPIVRTL